jgi:hypothetical protein
MRFRVPNTNRARGQSLLAYLYVEMTVLTTEVPSIREMIVVGVEMPNVGQETIRVNSHRIKAA